MSISKSLKELEADFVVTYSSKKVDADLSQLLDLLEEKGFFCQIRDLNESSLLIFIKLSGYTYAELYEKDLIKNYEFGITSAIDNKADKLRIVYEYLSGSSPDDVNLLAHKHVADITPITESISSTNGLEDIKSLVTLSNAPSTSFIKENFGIHIALYFEFVKHLLVWLSGLSVLGLLSYFKSKHLFSLTYCSVNLVWGTFFLAFWKKREKYLVSFWGSANYHLIQEHKSELNDINKYYEEKSSYKHKNNYEGLKFLKQLLFIPVAVGFAAVLVAYQLGCFVLEIFINEIYDGPFKGFIGLVPTILITVFVPILTTIFNLVSDLLIKYEKHNNNYTKQNSVLIKQFILNFLTSYMPLIITAFIYLPFAHLIQPNLVHIKDSISYGANPNAFYYKYLTHIKNQEDFKMNQERLNLQFNYFIVTNQVIQLVLKYALPQIISLVKSFISKPTYEPVDKSNEKDYLNNVRKYVSLPSYDVNGDFRFVTIVYGYLILFGPVWSLAPLVTLVFLFLTFKLDYLKLSNGKYFKPPIPQKIDSIYPWNYALFILTWLGSIISPAITAFYHHGDKPPKSLGQFALDKASVNTKSSTLLIILLLSEHGFLTVWFLLAKVFDLFKTDVEWSNDFTDNDIKLRHDYYTSQIKGNSEKRFEDDEWSFANSKSALTEANQILDKKFSDNEDVETIEPKATSTGVNLNQVADLEDIKDETDKIVRVPTETAEKVFATIDDNSHVKPNHETEFQKDYEGTSSPEPHLDNESSEGTSGVDEASTSSRTDKLSKKRSPLKKLLKKRK